MYRRIEAVDHRLEALVGAFQFEAGAARFGDVVHRRHPADLPALGVDQRRKVEAGIKALAILAHDPHLETAGRRLAGQCQVDGVLQGGEFLRRPVRVGRLEADQLVLVETGHPAEGGVDEGDAALQVDRPQAGDQRLRHRQAEGVGGA
ncbi:hypothetical protein SDC9_176911 [bioreactor metagenome]|uniref:Uncharacterized protein n=1 Tax=bioreactor metagenome TaxID=1076179 RepID=A0A645GRI3_9ZZZZ